MIVGSFVTLHLTQRVMEAKRFSQRERQVLALYKVKQ